MKNCPVCEIIHYADEVNNCLVCGRQLVFSQDSSATSSLTIQLAIDFTIVSCNHCATQNSYSQTHCTNCGDLLVDSDNLQQHMPLSVDPLVEIRTKAVQPLIDTRNKLVNSLGKSISEKQTTTDSSYLEIVPKYLDELIAQGASLRELLSRVDFKCDAVTGDGFSVHLSLIARQFENLFQVVEKILGVEAPPRWGILNQSICQCSTHFFESYLDIVEALRADSFSQAQEVMTQISNRLGKLGVDLENLWKVVNAGKQIQSGSTNLLEVIAATFGEDNSLKSFQNIGWTYFESVFKRRVEELPSDYGVQLAVCAIIAESCPRPLLLRHRVIAITDLLRRTHIVNSAQLKTVWKSVENDILHATRLMEEEGQKYTAIDFSKLSLSTLLNIGINTYQRLSEGSFKSLVNILLFGERLIEGAGSSYDEINRTRFGAKINGIVSKKQLVFKGIANSVEPLIAGMADDLEMPIRHADAHCDFSVENERIIINERNRDNIITQTFRYTEQEFIELIQKLREGVFAILVGVLCFQVEFFEDYIANNLAKYSDQKELEFLKYLFASKGIVIEEIKLEKNAYSNDINIHVGGYFWGEVSLSPVSTGSIFYAISQYIPQAKIISAELYDTSKNPLLKLRIPTIHFQRKVDSSRSSQLRLVDFGFKWYSEYLSLPNSLQPIASIDEIYKEHLLKPISAYLDLTLKDCLQYSQSMDKVSILQVNELEYDLRIFQQVLNSNLPPSVYINEYTSLMSIIRWSNDFCRALKLSLKPGRRSRTKSSDETRSKRAELLKVQFKLFS